MDEPMSEVKDNFIGTLAQILEAMNELQQHGTPIDHELKVHLQSLLNFNDKVDKLNGCYSPLNWTNLREIARGSEGEYNIKFALEECITFRECLDMSISYLFGMQSLESISRTTEDEEEIAS